jgi:hypothetical protein
MRTISLILAVAVVVSTAHASVEHAGLSHAHSDDIAFSTHGYAHSHGVEAEHESHEGTPAGHDSDGHRHEFQTVNIGTQISPKLLVPTWDWVCAEVIAEVSSVMERGKEFGRDPTKSPPKFLLTHALLI